MNLYETAYIRNGDVFYTDEAMLIAVLLHTNGNRKSKDLEYVSKLMRDINYEGPRVTYGSSGTNSNKKKMPPKVRENSPHRQQPGK